MKNRDDVVILGGSRTPFSKLGGALKDWSSSDLGAYFLPKAMEKIGLKEGQINFMVCASSLQAEVATQGNSIARQILVKSDMLSIPSVTIDQASCSGLAAVELGYHLMRSGNMDVVAVIGTEAMSNCGYILSSDVRWGRVPRGDLRAIDPLFPIRSSARPQGAIAEVDGEAALYGVTREDMDLWAYETQMRWDRARKAGFFKDEIIPVELKDGTIVDDDDTPKPWSNLEKMRALRTVGTSKTITAGNSPGLETGVAVVFLAKRHAAEALGIKPVAAIRDASFTAGMIECPLSMGARAAEILLKKNELSISDIDVIEAEEDFAAVVPITAKHFQKTLGADPEEIMRKTNPNGGAVAVGHPIATGGVRILLTMTREMQRKQHKLGLCTISGGLSQGVALLVENED